VSNATRFLQLEEAGQLSMPLGRGFPVAAPVGASEQLVAPIEGTNQHGYEKWKASDLGQQVMLRAEQRCFALAHSGESRIGMKAVFEWIRATYKIECNNTWTAFVARELRERHEALHDLIETRERKAT
jgi:hypothetical protein